MQPKFCNLCIPCTLWSYCISCSSYPSWLTHPIYKHIWWNSLLNNFLPPYSTSSPLGLLSSASQTPSLCQLWSWALTPRNLVGSVTTYKPSQCHNQEDHNQHFHYNDNLKPLMQVCTSELRNQVLHPYTTTGKIMVLCAHLDREH
jgi:hypothetical protein